ncbi:MAG: glycosyltransferase family 4 protein [Dehalococcoidales bacterium]|nr:glycosyltransferase family 4 protein [Dehalococcoidales bacterium]
MSDILPQRVILVRSRAIDPTVNKVAQALADSGNKVGLLVWVREGRKRGDDKVKGYRIHRFSLKAPYYKPSLLFYLPIWWFYEFFFLLMHRTNIIHACDLDTVLPAILVKMIKRNKLCYTIYDYYADILPQQVPYLVKKLVAFTEKFSLRFVDVLFLVDESRYEQVRGAKIRRVEYIYNSPEDHFHIRPELEHSPKIDIFYAGYLDKSRGLEYMMKSIHGLEDVNLTLAGTGPEESSIKAYAIKLSNIKYIEWIPYADVITNSLKADILFAFYDPKIPSNRYASPNKLFEAMMCAKPIIVNDGTTASRIVADRKCGLIVPYGDVAAIREAIINLKNDANLRQAMGSNGRKAYETHYSWEIMKNRLTNTYRELAKTA